MTLRICLLMWVATAVLVFGLPMTPGAQTKEQGIALYEEARKLHDGALSDDGIKAAVQKYEEALKVFEQANFEQGIGWVFRYLGNVDLDKERYDQAFEYYMKALKIARRTGDRKSEGRVLNNLGMVYDARGQQGKALEHYENSLRLSRKTGDVWMELRTIKNQGDAYRNLEQYKKATEHYRRALELADKTEDISGSKLVLSEMGMVYTFLNEYDNAAECYEKLLSISRDTQARRDEGHALNNLGFVRSQQGENDKALNCYKEALAIRTDRKDQKGVAQTLRNMANLFSKTGQFDKSAECWEKALVIYRQLKDAEGEALVLNSREQERGSRLFNEAQQLSEKVQTKEDIEKVVKLYEAAAKIFRKQGMEQAVAASSFNAAQWYKELGNYSRALELYGQSLELHIKNGDLAYEASALTDMAIVYFQQGRYDQALESCKKALVIQRKLGNEAGEANVYQEMGIIRRNQSRYDEAREYHRKALALFKKLGDLRAEAKALQGIALVNEEQGRYAVALEEYGEALEIAKKIPDNVLESHISHNMAIVYGYVGRYPEALALHEKNLALRKRLGDLPGESTTLGCMGTIYKDWSKYPEALEFYEKSLEIYKGLGDLAGEGMILNNMGGVYDSWSKYSKAMELYEKANKIFKRIGKESAEAGTLSNMANVYKEWGRDAEALRLYEKSLALQGKLGTRGREAKVLGNMASLFSDSGNYTKALEFCEKSLAIKREIGDVDGEALTLHGMGIVYLNWGQYAKAQEFFEQSLSIRKRLGDVSGEGFVLNSMGWLYGRWGQHSRAAEYYRKALDIAINLGEVDQKGQRLGSLGGIYQDMGDYPKALENFEKALGIWAEIGKPTKEPKAALGDLYLDMGDVAKAEHYVREGENDGSLGRLYLMKSDYTKAREAYEKLLADAQRSGSVDSLFVAHTGIGVCFEGISDDQRAEDHFLQAVRLIEDLRSSIPKAERETFFDVKINGFFRTAPYDGLARVRIRMNRPIEAFKDSEYTKCRIFAEAMSKRSESGGVDISANVLKQDQELNDQLAALKKKRQEAYEKANQEVISVIEPQVKEMEGKLQAHIKMLRDKYPLFAATKYPEPMDIGQTDLNTNEWVLAYHVTDPGMIIYLTRGKEIVKALYKPIPRDELDALVQAFRKPLEIVPGRDNFDEKLKSFDLAAGKKLSDLLLSDILANLPKQVPLLIVPDDSLGTLPFEMLVLDDKGAVKNDKELPYISDAEFFGDRNLISYCQSVTALTLSRTHAKAKAAETGLLAIADPVFQEKDERVAGAAKKDAPAGPLASLYKSLGLMAAEKDGLPGGLKFSRLSMTGELAKTLAEQDKKNAKICTGLDATKTNFLEKIAPHLNQYDEIVFATHGYFGKDLPGIMEPVLVLTLVPPGTDGFLRMTEVMGLNMNADIVALTACQTGLGKRTAGEGTMGMGRAFQYAGARSVLMSLWSVSEVASVNLVKSFFRNLKEGKSKSEALAAARAEVRSKGFDHPFFWAGFILVGERN